MVLLTFIIYYNFIILMIDLKLQLATAFRLKSARLNKTSERSFVIWFPLVEHRGAAQETYWRCRAMNPCRRSSSHFFKTMLLWLLFTKLNWQWCSHWGWAHRRINHIFGNFLKRYHSKQDISRNTFWGRASKDDLPIESLKIYLSICFLPFFLFMRI